MTTSWANPIVKKMLGAAVGMLEDELAIDRDDRMLVRYDWDRDWETWLMKMYRKSFGGGFAPHHAEFWAWAWRLEMGVAPEEPFVGIWARGGGKSSSAEGMAASCGVTDRRRYALYIRSTQTMADTSVSNIAHMLEHPNVERYYPHHAERLMSKFGSSKGWRRNRLRTAGGFTVDALGLDVAARGVKLEDQRPDLIIFDDIDELHDSPVITTKKIGTITKSLIPAGSKDAAIVAIQNLIIPHGIFSQLSDGRAQFLAKRRISGPHPAVRDMKTEVVERSGKRLPTIVSGTPSWVGQDLDECQRLMDNIGLPSFKQECQHEVDEREGALWTRGMIKYTTKMPKKFKRMAVAGDPSGGSAEIGIIGAGLGYDGIGYVVVDKTQAGDLGPLNWGNAMIDVYDDFEMDRVLGERNYGGDMVEGNIKAAAGMRRIPFEYIIASRGKTLRAEPVAALYEDELVLHVGTFEELEKEMTGWVQGDPWSPNRLDALVMVLSFLMLGKRSVGMRWGSQGRGATSAVSSQ